MSKNIKGSLYAFWVGFGLNLFWNIGLSDWKFWVYIIVLFILVETYTNHKTK